MRGPDGTVVGASSIARDISERKRAGRRSAKRLLTIARECEPAQG